MPTNAEVFCVLDNVGKEILESVTALLESKKKIGGNHTFFRNWFNLDRNATNCLLFSSNIQ